MSHPLQTHDDDDLADLQFTSHVDTTIKQNVQPVSTYDDYKNTPTTPTLTNDPTEQEYGNQIRKSPSMLSESAHPIACIFHCLFKFLAFTLYILGGIFTRGSHSGSRFIIITVFCILLLSADFWVVKNVTGRLLVGLRWWNRVSEDGQETRWIFESSKEKIANKFDHAVFWSVLYVTPALWSSFFFIGLLKFEFGWLITVIMGLTLSYANVYGYWKCSSDQKAKFQNLMVRGAELGAVAAIKNNLFGFLARATESANGAAAGGAGAGAGGAASGYPQQPGQQQQQPAFQIV